MSLKEHNVAGYKGYENLISNLTNGSEDRIVTLFCASLDSEGRSWCGDCQDALPIVNNAIEAAKANCKSECHYVFVGIDREEWRNKDNGFRQHNELKLTNIPTLILSQKGSEQKRLTERECLNKDRVFSFFQ